MDSDNIQLNAENFNLDFLVDNEIVPEVQVLDAYKILIVDDEKEMHTSTQMLLKDFYFEGRGLELISAYTGSDAKSIIAGDPDIAVVFLDVVMEENNSGLQVVEYIRKVLKNKMVRIILRTGQPGEAPEDRVIMDYDINDYRLKTEMTVQRLHTSLYEALRSYRDLTCIENNRKGLERIIESSSVLFTKESIQDFFSCILNQIMTFRETESSVLFRQKDNGFVCLENNEYGRIIAATGRFTDCVNKNISEVMEIAEICEKIKSKDALAEEIFQMENGFFIWKKSRSRVNTFIYVEGDVQRFELDLIKVFVSNYSLALDSFIVNQQMMDTQKVIIYTLGETIEKRSHETANHVRRVSEIVYLLADRLGIPEEECSVLRISSTMHDVGKIGIPDKILMKPGRLTDDEFNQMKEHTQIGYEIFSKQCELEVLRKAAKICLCHHEKFDGSGYPNELAGEDIPIEARIVAVADVFDALTHKRCYKNAWSYEKTLDYFREQKGRHFDPRMVDLLEENLPDIMSIMETYAD